MLRPAGRASASFAFVLLASLLASCNTITRAPQGTPRVELELVVATAEGFTAKLQGLDAAFAQALEEFVLGKADVGLRFYPVPTARYQKDAQRPEYRMTVTVRELSYGLDYRTVTAQPGADPVIESWVNRLEAAVAVDLVKRREGRPELVVGSSQQSGAVSVARSAKGEETEPAYTVQRSGEQQVLNVRRGDLLRAVDAGLARALKELLPAIDRDLNMQPQ